MPKKPPANLSRRDAIKLLGAAAGATVLANLPSRWSTPEFTAGVLPAHAQTSATSAPACEGLALTATIAAIVGTGNVFSDPVPDLTSGSQNAQGYTMSWNCGDRCILLLVSADGGEGDATIRLTGTVVRPDSSTSAFDLLNDSGGSGAVTAWIYLNAGSGDYNSGTWRSSDGPPASYTVDGCPAVAIT